LADKENQVSGLRDFFGSSRNELWEKIAGDLGGEYKEGGILSNDVLRVRSGEWEITLDSYASGEGDALVTHTRMRAPFINKDGLYFKIAREGLFAHVEELLGMQDIATGDEYFDKHFLIKGNNEEKVHLLLKSPKLRTLIREQPQINFEIRDDDGWFGADFPEGVDELYFECYGLIHDKKKLEALFELFSTTLERLVQIDSAYDNDPEVEL
jgi:hypothetical protein